jgi:DNA-binding transcriptional MerR regulator
MSEYRIAEVAELVGVPATALRYYEDIGLVTPQRSPNGYRRYGDRDVARLRFVAAAKNLGIPLDDVRGLASAYEVEDCAAVAHQVVELVAGRLADTRLQIAASVALAAELQDVMARLAAAPAAGPCGDGCPCLEPPAIACSLDGASVPGRVAEWRALLATATARQPLPGGASIGFPADPATAGEVARLAAAEQQCCGFFTFTLRLSAAALWLDVTAPAEAAELVVGLFGQPVD